MKDKKIIICASTHHPEEEILIQAFQKLNLENIIIILVPRHPDRAKAIYKKINDTGLSISLFSEENHKLNYSKQVILVDKIGHLESLFSIADIAFIGGSLIPHGGQNFLEAVQFGLPIFSGPNTYNFKEISEDLQSLQILNIIDSIDDLALKWGDFSHNSQIKELSQNYLLSRQGAVQRSVEKLVVLLKE